MNTSTPRIAIIGGGISGLAVAYHLTQAKQPPCQVVIYETKQRLGGNAETVDVVLGEDYSQPDHPPYERWADLGVNDFNTVTYKKLVKAMNAIGFQEGVHYKPLEDSIAFFTPDGRITYTDDRGLKYGVSDPDTRLPAPLEQAFKRLMNAALAASKEGAPQCDTLTVGAFTADYIAGITEAEERRLAEEARDCLFYPRIAAMYFTDERGPEFLPLKSPMNYYRVQEGYEADRPAPQANRCYFVHGAQAWIDALRDYLIRERQVEFRYNFPTKILAGKEGVYVFRVGEHASEGLSQPEHYAQAVLACHADDALRCFRAAGLSEEVAEILGRISYTNSLAVCHTDASLLPPNRAAWRAYNVMIRPGVSTVPYSMTYVCNRHQNDGAETQYQRFGLPQHFVTLNPAWPIHDDYVLRIKNPQFRLASGYRKDRADNNGDKAITYFKHNVLDFNCWEAQVRLEEIQGVNNIYFSGGWSRGAGLHEECWEQGEIIAEMIAERLALKIAAC